MPTHRHALVLVVTLGVACGGPRPEYPEVSVCGSSLEPPAAVEAVSLPMASPGPISTACGVEAGVALCAAVNPPAVTDPVQAVAAGRGRCALGADGVASCHFSSAAVQPTGTFVKLAMGSAANACGLRADGTIECFGVDRQFSPEGAGYVDVTVGAKHVCGLKADGTAVCNPNPGAYCQGDPAPGPFVRLHAAHDGNTTCGVRPDGSAACWGKDLGAIPGSPPYVDVVPVDSLQPGICALGKDGAVTCSAATLAETPEGAFTALVSMHEGVCALGDGRPVCWATRFGSLDTPPTAIGIVEPRAPEKPGWFEVRAGNVSASFPTFDVKEQEVTAGDVPVHRWTWTTTSPGPQLLALEVIDPPADIAALGTEALLQFAILAKVQAFDGGQAKRLSYRRLQGRDGASFYVEYADGRAVRSSAYVDGGRLYVASGMSMRDDGDAWDRAHALIDSLRFE